MFKIISNFFLLLFISQCLYLMYIYKTEDAAKECLVTLKKVMTNDKHVALEQQKSITEYLNSNPEKLNEFNKIKDSLKANGVIKNNSQLEYKVLLKLIKSSEGRGALTGQLGVITDLIEQGSTAEIKICVKLFNEKIKGPYSWISTKINSYLN